MSLNDAETIDTDNLIDDDQEETVIIFDNEEGEGAQSSQDESEDNTESSVIKDLRKQLRQSQHELNQVKSKPQQTEQSIVVGDKPKFDEFDYDTVKYEEALDAYHDRKAKAENQAKQSITSQQQLIDTFNKQVKDLGQKDFDIAKNTFNVSLTDSHKSTILAAVDNMALIVYTLGKHPAKIEALMQISDPIKLAAAVAKIEKDIKVIKSPRNKVEPDKTVKGNASGAASAATGVNKQLEKLREEAKKTGNMNKVVAFKKANNIK